MHTYRKLLNETTKKYTPTRKIRIIEIKIHFQQALYKDLKKRKLIRQKTKEFKEDILNVAILHRLQRKLLY